MLNKTHQLLSFMNNPTQDYPGINKITYLKNYDAIKGNIVINPLRCKAKLLKKQSVAKQRTWIKYGMQAMLEQFLDSPRFTVYETETHGRYDTKANLKQLQKNNIDYVFCIDLDDMYFSEGSDQTLLWGMLEMDQKTYLTINVSLRVINTATQKIVYQSTGIHTQPLAPVETKQMKTLTEGTVSALMNEATKTAMRKLIRGWEYLTQ